MNLQKELKSSLMVFLDSGDKTLLRLLIDKHPEVIVPSHGDYPDFHRLVDISIGGKHYRVCRQISADEKITLSLIDEALDEMGVPIWLEGKRLREWAKAEKDNPSDKPVN